MAANSANPCFILETFRICFFSPFSSFNDAKNQVASITISELQLLILVMFNLINKKKVNYLISELSDCEKRLLAKGLNFKLPPKYLDYTDYLFSFELFYRNIRNLGFLSNEDLDFVKARAKEAALFYFRNYNNNVPQHLSKE